MATPEINTRLRILLDAGRDRWILWAPVALGTGIGIYFALPAEPVSLGGPFVTATALVVFLLCRTWMPGRLASLALLLLAVGFTASQLRTQSVAAPGIGERIGPLTVEGRILSVEPQPKGMRVVLDRLKITRLDAHQIPDRVRLRLNGGQPAMRPGDWIRARAMLSPPPPPPAPGAFDYQQQAFFLGLGGYGFVMGPAALVHGREGGSGWDRIVIAIEGLRQDIDRRIRSQLPGDTGGTVSAMVTGYRGGIAEATMDDVRDSGLAHLLAISGINIGLAAGFLFFVVRAALALVPPLALRYPIKQWASVAAVFGAGAYSVIAGLSVPTVRSFLMIAVALVAVFYERRALSMRLVAFAAAVILLGTPESLLSASFQMSFAAVVALIAFYEDGRDGWMARLSCDKSLRGRALAYLAAVAITSLIAGAATAPYAAYHFNRLAAYGLLANMIAVPVTAVWIVPWTLAVLVALPFGLEGVPVAMMGLGVDVILAVAHEVASWSGASGLVPSAPAAALVAVTFGGLWICLGQGRWRWAGSAGVAVALVLVLQHRPPDVLVDDTGRLFAVRTDDGGMAVSNHRIGRFNREIWLRRAAVEEGDEESPWDTEAGGPVACDSLGCVYRSAGRTVSFARHADAVAEDCWRSDVVVSSVPALRRCGTAVLIGPRDLAANGAHAIWLGEAGIRIESVNGWRGDRPWVIHPPKPRPPSTSASGRSAVPEP